MHIDRKTLQTPAELTLPHIVPYFSSFHFIQERMTFQTLCPTDELTDDEAQHYTHYFTQDNINVFRSNAQTVTSNGKFDETLLHLFRTEYHIRLLWGSHSRFTFLSPRDSEERHREFDKVLNSLFEMCSTQTSHSPNKLCDVDENDQMKSSIL